MADSGLAMTSTIPTEFTTPPAMSPSEGLALRPSTELGTLPAGSRLVIPEATIQRPVRATSESSAPDSDPFIAELSKLAGTSEPWLLTGLVVLASAGWLLERRRRRHLETEKDSMLWAGVQPPASSIITTLDEVGETVPHSEHEATPADAMAMTGFGETTSHREATLIDLHQLDRRLRRRRARGDLLGAVHLLQRHLADFRYTSPWVFLELRELHHLLARQQEWEMAREAFQSRFTQKAPLWQAPSTADAQLADDSEICRELVPEWPYREARLVVLRWMLGDSEIRQAGYRPPLLALGVYRDLMFVDRVLDHIMLTRVVPPDSLL